MARLAAQHHKQQTAQRPHHKPTNTRSAHAAKGGGAAHHQPRFAAHPQRGTGGEQSNNPRSDRARGEGARHNRCYANPEGAPAVAQQLCITPCYVELPRAIYPRPASRCPARCRASAVKHATHGAAHVEPPMRQRRRGACGFVASAVTERSTAHTFSGARLLARPLQRSQHRPPPLLALLPTQSGALRAGRRHG